jgi:hypothetical protein
MTSTAGAYSANWTPAYPASYLLDASWGGNNQLAPSQSSPASVTVTGSVQPSPTVLVSSPATASRGQSVTLSITVFNPTSSALNANVTVEITGPNNYLTFDTIQVRVSPNSHSTGYYDWNVPNQAGTYSLTVSLFPTAPGGIDTATIQVT